MAASRTKRLSSIKAVLAEAWISPESASRLARTRGASSGSCATAS
ncbi:Uncharacterised protein [Bordetella pertussis]|nr:Uncharacterised protein [Bordetella pertussis]CFW50448.1 Uncharacterised protein [Bordetella pertussis]